MSLEEGRWVGSEGEGMIGWFHVQLTTLMVLQHYFRTSNVDGIALSFAITEELIYTKAFVLIVTHFYQLYDMIYILFFDDLM